MSFWWTANVRNEGKIEPSHAVGRNSTPRQTTTAAPSIRLRPIANRGAENKEIESPALNFILKKSKFYVCLSNILSTVLRNEKKEKRMQGNLIIRIKYLIKMPWNTCLEYVVESESESEKNPHMIKFYLHWKWCIQ